MDEKDYNVFIKEINNNPDLKKEYLINDIIKLRVHSLLRSKPPECSVLDCNLPLDHTLLGWDTSCPYHRLLFDHWLYEIAGTRIGEYTKQGRRSAFTQWVNKFGKENCDEIVDEMSHIPINWKC